MLKACYASPLVSLLARASTVARLAVLVYRLLPLFAAILVANAGAQNLARGVVASYSFEGDFRDAALGNNGVGVGGVLFEDGVHGLAASFPNFDDHVEIPHRDYLSLPGDYTISVWVYLTGWSVGWVPDRGGDGGWIISKCKSHDHTTNWNLCIHHGLQRFRFIRYSPTDGGELLSNTVVERYRWYHIVVVGSAAENKTRMYVNGILDAETRFISAHTVQGHPIWIGAHYGLSARQIDGRVDEVRIYNRALTTAEVQLLFYQTYQARFISLGFVSDAPAIPTSISADGRFIVGRIQPGASADVAEWGNPWHGFLWTRETGAQDIYPQTGLAWAMGVSADGSVVVGVDRGWNSYRWVRTLNTLVLIAGGFSATHDLSDDGQVVVGLVYGYTPYVSGYRWTPHSGLQTLGTLPGDRFSEAFGVSADGSVIVGTTHRDWAPYWHQNRAYLWDQRENRMKELTGPLGGWPSFHAMGVSADGSTVVGIAHSDANANIWALPYAAFRWTTSSRRMESLGSLGGQRTYVWHAVSADGSVIYGGSENTLRQWRAFRWTVGRGMEDINEVFRYTIPPRWVLHNVVDCTPDGRFIVGWGTNPSGKIEGFLLDTYTGASPSPPTNLRAFALSSTQIQLDWKDNSMGEQGFEIERKGESGDYTVIAQVGANVTTYTDGGLTRDTTYTYRVRAYNAAGKSPYSNPASATTCSGNGLLHEERCFYRANLHSHSSYSDGRWWSGDPIDPWDLFYIAYTRGWNAHASTDHWDIWAITDHGEQIAVQESPDQAWKEEWEATKSKADSVMAWDGFSSFVALRGFEWTGYTDVWWNVLDPRIAEGGHINVFGSKERKGAYFLLPPNEKYPILRKDVLPNLISLYRWLADPSNKAVDGGHVIAQFNHPTTYDGSSHFAFAGAPFRLPPDLPSQPGLRSQLLKVVALMELGSHVGLPYEGGDSNFLTGDAQLDANGSNEYWFRIALAQGWHLAPTNNGDNHPYRVELGDFIPLSDMPDVFPPEYTPMTGVWADSFTGLHPQERVGKVLDALRARRVFASEDLATRLSVQARLRSKGKPLQNGWYWMGSTFEMPAEADEIELKIYVKKEDALHDDYIWKVEVFVSPGWLGSEYQNLPAWPPLAPHIPAYSPGTSEVTESVYLRRELLENSPRNALGEVYIYVRAQVFTRRVIIVEPLAIISKRLLYSAPIWIRGVPRKVSSPPDKEPL